MKIITPDFAERHCKSLIYRKIWRVAEKCILLPQRFGATEICP